MATASINKPLILVTNDDGITSKGIKTLIETVAEIGEVVVVAPNSPQSGMGHAITITEPVRLYKSNIFEGINAFECSGTPVDCVKIAKKVVLKDRKIDLVVSGINHGSNSSISVIYSGTMSAAIEAAIEKIPTVGFSLCDYSHDADFSQTKPFILSIVKQILEKGISDYTALNVNFPIKSSTPYKGVKICRQAMAKYEEEYERRVDPMGREYFWSTGELVNNDHGQDSDEWALKNNYVSIVPCQFDLTSYSSIAKLNIEWKLE
jgi:5'-nucleotidase